MIRSSNGEFGLFIKPKHSAWMNPTKNEDIPMNKYDLMLFSDEFDKESETEITLPYKRFEIMQERLANDGTLYLLGYK